MPESPLIVAHRGLPTRFPDNTLAGFMAASDIADAVELDVRRSGDGKLVLAHEPLLDVHVIARTPWSTLVELDLGGGHHPALLDEVMAALPDTPLQLEVKNAPYEPGYEPDHRLALETAERARAGDMVTSFNPATLDAVRMAYPDLPTGLAVEPLMTLDQAVRQCLDAGYAALVPRQTMVGHDSTLPDGLEIYPWTVNEPRRAVELVEAGVSGIITDDPALIRRHLEDSP